MKRVLAHRDARLFLIGQSLSLLGDTALWLALGLWVKELTGSSSAAGLVFLCIAAPGLLSPLGGLLVDRFPRRSVLLVVNPLTALIVLPLLLVRDDRDVWLIYAVTTLYGTSYVILAAGQSALLTTLLPGGSPRPGERGAADGPRDPAARRAGRRRGPLHRRGRRRRRHPRRRHVPDGHRRAVRAQSARAPSPSRSPGTGSRRPRPARGTSRACPSSSASCSADAISDAGDRLRGDPALRAPARARQAGLVRRRADGRRRRRRDHRRAHRDPRDAPPRRDRAHRPRPDDLRRRLPARHGSVAADRPVRQGPVQPRRAVDVHRDGHAAAAHDARAAPRPRLRGERIRRRRPADVRHRDRRRAGGPSGLSASTVGRSRRDRRDRGVPAV